jgi:hypothetical protein
MQGAEDAIQIMGKQQAIEKNLEKSHKVPSAS